MPTPFTRNIDPTWLLWRAELQFYEARTEQAGGTIPPDLIVFAALPSDTQRAWRLDVRRRVQLGEIPYDEARISEDFRDIEQRVTQYRQRIGQRRRGQPRARPDPCRWCVGYKDRNTVLVFRRLRRARGYEYVSGQKGAAIEAALSIARNYRLTLVVEHLATGTWIPLDPARSAPWERASTLTPEEEQTYAES